MKNRILLATLSIVCVLSSALAFVACGGGVAAHQHTWSREWTTDDAKHWHTCTISDCIERESETVHDFTNGVCLCGKKANTLGLAFALNNGRKNYSCTGIGTATVVDIVIPSTYNGKPVTRIGSNAFYNCSNLTSITIGDGVISIGFHALYNCSGLTSITIPSSVTSIDNYAFEGCSDL